MRAIERRSERAVVLPRIGMKNLFFTRSLKMFIVSVLQQFIAVKCSKSRQGCDMILRICDTNRTSVYLMANDRERKMELSLF